MGIVVIGADGQLGSDLCKIIPQKNQIPLTIKDIDITNKNQVFKIIKKYNPHVVINTAAYHRVDDCEENETIAFAVNVLGPKNLASVCKEIGATLVHYSTDYVFAGDKMTPYAENDCPSPQSVYGISKLAGEYCLKYITEKHLIIRSSGLYGVAGCLGKGGGNFIENMRKAAKTKSELRVVKDEILSPTYTLDLAQKTYEMIQKGLTGLFHVVNHGECSWYEFAVEIFTLLGKKIKIIPVTSDTYKSKAQRPKYSVLKNARLQELGLDDMRPWKDALRAYLKEK